MFCSSCGTQAVTDARWCGNCGAALRAPASPAPTWQAPAASAPPAWQAASAPPAWVAPAAYPPAWQAQQPQVVVIRNEKSAGLAAILCFFWCGLGQIYNGQIAKGIIFMILYVISFLAILLVIGFITTPILWIWGMVDAYRTAERLNQRIAFA